MSNEIEVSKSFQEKMFEKIRDQMGDLLTKEDLKEIVKVAMQKAFFEGRSVQDRFSSYQKESLFVEMVKDKMNTEVIHAVHKWLEEHQDEVKKAIDDTISKGFTKIVLEYIENLMQPALQQFAETLRNKGLM